MLKETEKFLIRNIDNIEGKTLAVAYSGGIDSQVMLNLAYRLKEKLSFNLIIIHVNYNLRGEDSINDELFARSMAKKYNTSNFFVFINDYLLRLCFKIYSFYNFFIHQ